MSSKGVSPSEATSHSVIPNLHLYRGLKVGGKGGGGWEVGGERRRKDEKWEGKIQLSTANSHSTLSGSHFRALRVLLAAQYLGCIPPEHSPALRNAIIKMKLLGDCTVQALTLGDFRIAGMFEGGVLLCSC